MRIALLTNNRLPPREGIGHHLVALGRALAARGHRVLLVGAGDRPVWQTMRLDDLPVRLYPRRAPRPLHHAAARPALQRWLAEEGAAFDLVHVHLPLLPPLEVPTRVVVTVHTPLLADTAAPRESLVEALAARAYARLWAVRYERFWLARAERVFAVSSRVAAELARDYPLASAPVILPNGVDLERFRPSPADAREPFLLYVGRLGPRKGLPELIDAFAALDRPGLRLVLLGEGPLRAALERRARRHGLGERVVFAGFAGRNTVAAALRRCLLFVLPSRYEGLPLALLEAMAAGASVVTTPACRLAEFGIDPPFLVADGADAAALALAMRRLLDSPGERRALAARGRALVEARFGWARVAEAFLAHLEQGVRRAA